MKHHRLISQFLSRQHRNPISQNPNSKFNFLGFKQRLNSNFIQSQVPPWHHSYFMREFASSSQESKAVPSERVSAIVNELMGLTQLETAELTELVRTKLGIKEMPTMTVMMPGMGFGVKGGLKGGGGAAKAEAKAAEKTAFDLKLEGGFDAGSKIKIIKEVRTFTDLGLKEAKDLVEKAPTLLKKGVPKEEAEKIIEKMKEIGAKVTME